ncbi:hypothetical protein DVH05_016076 [Phytophthora capsici]|nr:hypothetical protein DVH05_016076 [Phytophthora capsici]|eukprot:jgi/Phyca11/117839/e_gw1.34.410.1
MAGQPEHSEAHRLKTDDSMMTPLRKPRRLKSPPKVSQTRPVYPVRIGPKITTFDDWSDEEIEDAQPVKPWSQSA